MIQNAAPMCVAEKCGFVNEGRSMKYMKISGVWEDHFHFVKLNDKLESCL